jgi:hypothetical protein
MKYPMSDPAGEVKKNAEESLPQDPPGARIEMQGSHSDLRLR